MTNYSWKGFDGKNYSKDSALVRIKVNSVNDAPLVVDSIVYSTPLQHIFESDSIFECK